jgi:hypothetical protein
MNRECDTHLPLIQTARQRIPYQHYVTTAVNRVAAPTTTNRLFVITNDLHTTQALPHDMVPSISRCCLL